MIYVGVDLSDKFFDSCITNSSADYVLGAKLLVLYSTRDFTDASEAQQLFGTAPYTAMSGQSRFVGFRRGANKLGRNTFQQFARCSIRSSL